MLRPVLGDIVAAARVLSALPEGARAVQLEHWIRAARLARRARARGGHGRNGTLMAEALACETETRAQTRAQTETGASALEFRALALVAQRFAKTRPAAQAPVTGPNHRPPTQTADPSRLTHSADTGS
jgi:1,6-anhydro-N-acetylmuramate kinase